MEFKYRIGKDEYLDALMYQLKHRRASALNLILLAVLTVGQLGFAVWNVASGRLAGTLAVIVLIFSGLICVMQLVYQLSLPTRAKHAMERDIAAGKIAPEFWGTQHLRLKDELLELHCGKQKLSYDCAYFQKAEVCGPLLVLTMHKDNATHQLMVPLAALGGEAGSGEFTAALKAAKRASILSGFDSTVEKPPEATQDTLCCTYTVDSFIHDYISSARRAYLTSAGWTLSTIARLAGTAFMLYHLIHGSFESTAYKIFAVLVCVLLCYPYLVTFSPLIRPIARKYALSLFSGLDTVRFRLDYTPDSLIFSGDTFYNRIARTQVKAVRDTAKNRFIYLKDGSSVTIRK